MTTDCRDHRIGFDTMAEVARIEFPDHDGRDGSAITVGCFGVTRIEPYNEDGGMSFVPWFIVWRGDAMAMKVNAAHLASVIYASQDPS